MFLVLVIVKGQSSIWRKVYPSFEAATDDVEAMGIQSPADEVQIYEIRKEYAPIAGKMWDFTCIPMATARTCGLYWMTQEGSKF